MLFGVLLGALVSGCWVKGVREERQTVSVYVSGDLDLTRLSEAAALVNNGRESGFCLWLFCGDVLGNRSATAFMDGSAQVELLNASGVDAVVLGPEWFELGPDRFSFLVEQGRFYFLGANLVDSSGEPLGHPFMVKRFSVETLGLIGVWLDATDTRFGLNRVEFIPADFAVHKTVPLVRPRAGIVGAVVRPKGTVPDWGLDFAVGTDQEDIIAVVPPARSDRIVRLDLSIQDGRVVDFSIVEEEFGAVEPDQETGRAVDSVLAAIDSIGSCLITESTVQLSPEVLTRALVDGYLKQKRALHTSLKKEIPDSGFRSGATEVDGFVYDIPLVVDTLGPGPVTNSSLVEVLQNPGRLVLLVLDGREMKSLLQDRSVSLEWRHGLRSRRLVLRKEYRLAMTLDFLLRHPEPALAGYELDQEQFWVIAARVLASA